MVSSNSVGGAINLDFVRETRATGHGPLLSITEITQIAQSWANQVRNIIKQYALPPPNVL